MGVLLLVGTRKGLFLVRGDDEPRAFELEGPLLPGSTINHAVGDALRGLPVADLVMDERRKVRPLVHVYVDGERAHDLRAPLRPESRVRIVAAIVGG